ncbi:MAG TPA: thiamine-phosphate kinase [Xanthobacteraceae bacterium]|nr:thiamine-phosphate kinase [Xanthobacteraceae bacterium]
MSDSDHDGLTAEERLIARHFAPIARHPGALGLVDDCAFYAPPAGEELVLKTDAIVGTVHFFPEDPADRVAKKALRVNLSDLAAKGATPAGFLLSLALPRGIEERWLAGFAQGLKEDSAAYQCPLFGGDTVRSPGPVMISVTVFGTVPAGGMIRRDGARVGDVVMVTGTIGDAVLGLRVRRWDVPESVALAEADAEELVDRYLLPRPRLALRTTLRTHAHAAMDVSDGLVGDLAKLCRASGLSAEIAVDRVPLSQPARAFAAQDHAVLEAMLTGGDDYEILFTVPPERVAALQEEAAAAGVPVAAIGRTTEGAAPPKFVGTDGKPLQFTQTAFSHF